MRLYTYTARIYQVRQHMVTTGDNYCSNRCLFHALFTSAESSDLRGIRGQTDSVKLPPTALR